MLVLGKNKLKFLSSADQVVLNSALFGDTFGVGWFERQFMFLAHNGQQRELLAEFRLLFAVVVSDLEVDLLDQRLLRQHDRDSE